MLNEASIRFLNLPLLSHSHKQHRIGQQTFNDFRLAQDLQLSPMLFHWLLTGRKWHPTSSRVDK